MDILALHVPSSSPLTGILMRIDTHHHDHGHDHDHDHDHGSGRPEDNPLWRQDNISLKSVGIDIGSAGTQILFSLLKLRRMGEDLSSRYVVVSRESIYRSPVALTPYVNEDRIDDQALGNIIAEAYAGANLKPEDIDTGAVILTGEAIRRDNARAIGDLLAAQGGEFVCATAGHNMEARLAAFGSGSVLASHLRNERVLNIDIGGGTTKLTLIDNGRVLETAAVYIGGRLLVIDEQRRIVRLDAGAKYLARQIGRSWKIGDTVSVEELKTLTEWMAAAIVSAIRTRPLPPEIAQLYLTPPLQDVGNIASVMFSGGVSEYVYGHEERDFEDLGKLLGHAIRYAINSGRFPWPLLPAGECIRATAIGASEHSVQVSGNTIHVSDSSLLPRKNLQVLRPNCDFSQGIDANAVARSILDHFKAFDMQDAETDVALAFRWRGTPSYERVSAFVHGIVQAMSGMEQRSGKPLVIVLDGDIAQSIGTMLHEEGMVSCPVLVIDGITLHDFEFIDVGRWLEPSHTVPVTIKSLIFK